MKRERVQKHFYHEEHRDHREPFRGPVLLLLHFTTTKYTNSTKEEAGKERPSHFHPRILAKSFAFLSTSIQNLSLRPFKV